MEATTSLPLTAMDTFNQFARALEEAQQGGRPWNELLTLFEAYEGEFGSSHLAFHFELRYQENTEHLQTYAPLALDALQRIETYNHELRQALTQQDQARCWEIAELITRRLGKLHDAYRELRSIEPERLSPSPMVSELLRCGKMFLEGRLSAELLRERTQGLLHHFQGVLASLEGHEPDPKEASLWHQNRQELEEALDAFTGGCLDLEAALSEEDVDLDQVQHLLTEIKDSTEVVYHISQSLIRAIEQGESKSCFRCGSKNDLNARVCSSCQAALPNFTTEQLEQVSQINVRLEEGGIQASQSQLPHQIRSYLRNVEEAAQGTRSADELRRDHERQLQRSQQLEKGMRELKAPEGVSEELLATFESLREGILEALEEFREGLEWVDEYFTRNDTAQLWEALKRLEPSAERLAGLQARINNWIREAQGQR